MRIAIDAMGGDFAPEPIVDGALQAMDADPELEVVLVGDRARVEPLTAGKAALAARIEYDHTTEVVEMHESPARALRSKPNSSINRCWALLAKGKVEGLVSAGHTGAVVAGGLATRRFLKGVQRPGIAVTMPSATGWSVMLDVGANVAPKPEHLFQYAVMGRIFARQILNCPDPTIGLLNVGSEEAKGTGLAKQTAQMFLNSPWKQSFKGNIEGRDVLRGLVDVIVCDGFVGNVVLKCCEGMVEFLMKEVSEALLGKLVAEKDVAKRALHDLAAKYHYSEFGGAPLLGIDGVCLICHGSSDAKAIRNAIKAAKRFNIVNRQIVGELELAFAVPGQVVSATAPAPIPAAVAPLS